eukprot:TRINITY_DN26717_c0_g1_i1.p1 TRINITY_DN26717_c0_g1~~TRINITY_DN26717_c0_g1_i1.p1  ORF type:complete len:554 (+),score=83.06 TRINITY_DN26717_c0_g1_i1:166-1827(+)
MPMTQWMRERKELVAAMKASPSVLKQTECDLVPPLELIGIYTVHATVTRMVAAGDLDIAVGTYLNAALGCHTFCIMHHCTHESISQHNVEHEALENSVFRLASMLIFFDDSYKEAHRAHHARTQEPDDPDLILSHTSLPELGALLFHMTGRCDGEPTYIHLGVPITPRQVSILYRLGLSRLLSSGRVMNRLGLVNWDMQTMKMACIEALGVMKKHADYRELAHALRGTWHSARMLSYVILSLFFARYPHRNGIELRNDVDSFYDNSYRGQGQVDLWMMGEGAHHLHHAKSDVSYSVLSKVNAEVEETYPHIKAACRGNADLTSLEYTKEMPQKLGKDDEPSMQFGYERTQAIRECKEMLGYDPKGAIVKIAKTVLHNAVHCCTTADRQLLRNLCKDMRLNSFKLEEGHPLPISKWHETVLSEDTASQMHADVARVEAEVGQVAAKLGASMPNLPTEESIKTHYLDFFESLADAMASAPQQDLFMRRCAEAFPGAAPKDRKTLMSELRSFLESPVPANFGRMTRHKFREKNYKSSAAKTRQRVANLFFAHQSKL